MLDNKVLILTALEEVERQVLRTFISQETIVYHPQSKTDYYAGVLPTESGEITIILARTDQTNVSASLETNRALDFFKPQYAFFVGIAGGLKDVGIGDIVIGKDVFAYERGKTTVDGFKSRPGEGNSSYKLERLATNFAKSDRWKQISKTLPTTNFPAPVNVQTGTIAAGEKVDASVESDLHKFLKVHCNHALAIEMEGFGFLEACRQHPSVEGLLIRGISDLVDDKSASDAGGSQPYATHNAAVFTFELIKQLYSEVKGERLPTDEERKLFVKLACELYPGGIRENSVWDRAGGQIAAIAISNNGKSQWLEAIRLISNGGGGKVTFNSILEAMLEDHESNRELIQLRGI
ncbi:phosphorylase family protein [Spirosoma arboris]|nr:5'-methylthioadenosine/S-adenosylhomocysteine nucleosidase [Spirosoma arboris]